IINIPCKVVCARNVGAPLHQAVSHFVPQKHTPCPPLGLLAEFFKCFQDDLAPFLTMSFNDIIEKPSMPLIMRQASLCLNPKPGKDHQIISNYRPLSILNSDNKLLTKIIAK
uniref:Reverse transcriptase domain-containing protein n=1 Tax=Cyprinodon variegatus TaxID=28743 RepID=A0A3Q2ED41_CYPVA